MDRQILQRESPAADAAGLLIRIGFGLLVLVAPFSALFFRRAFVILVPIGAFLIVISAVLIDVRGYFEKLRAVVLSPIGLICVGIGLWTAMSLIWTPFPGPAGERAFRTLGNAVIALIGCAALPDRMRLSNLNLLTIGVALAAVTLVFGALLGPSALRLVEAPDAPTYPRAAIAAGVLVWPALAWTITRGRDIEGILLIGACGVAAIASGSPAAAIVLFSGLLVYLSARSRQRMTGIVLAWSLAAIVLLAPLGALLAQWLSQTLALGTGHWLTQIGLWGDIIAQQPVRLLTGHGFDTLGHARMAGLVSPQAPLGLLPELWYDLGLVGGAGVALLIFFGMRALGAPSPHVAAASLAVTTSVILFMIIDPTSTQQWWLSVCVLASITMTAVLHGQYRTRRPRAPLIGRFGLRQSKETL